MEKAVLESMRRVFWFARCYEDLFVKQLQEKSMQEAKKELARKKRELEKTEKLHAELDKDKEQNDGINVIPFPIEGTTLGVNPLYRRHPIGGAFSISV